MPKPGDMSRAYEAWKRGQSDWNPYSAPAIGNDPVRKGGPQVGRDPAARRRPSLRNPGDAPVVNDGRTRGLDW